MRRLMFLFWKELLELRQDPRMLPIVFVAPVLQLIVLGYAATTDVRNVPVVVADADEGRREVAALLAAAGNEASSIERILPSLEDVFIHHVAEAEAAGREARP